ncbi:MAG: hypothetical protein EOP82_00125 [Variovorax sp.]|nr:MAG: hypothetical protein EOP82_00125 [Variovorax sp.]
MDRPLRTLTFLRSAFNLLFAIYLLAQPMVAQGSGHSGYYALGDGAIALVLAVVLFRDPNGRWLFVLALFDALVRLTLGAFLFANPGIGAHALASALTFTAIIFALLALGVAGMVVGLVGQPVPVGIGGMRRARAWPVVIAGLCTLLFGVALVLGPPGADNSRLILCAYAFVFGLALLYGGIRLSRLRTA